MADGVPNLVGDAGIKMALSAKAVTFLKYALY